MINNKFYNSQSPSVLSFHDLHLVGGLEVNKNDLIRNACGHGIELVNVQGGLRMEPRKVFIKENLIQECQQGHGINIERGGACLIENCEVIKCEGNGIHAVMS